MNKKTDNPTRNAFLAHIQSVESYESDKDMILKAYRLERHESARKPVNPLAVAGVLGVSAAVCTGLVLGYESGNFIPALIGAGIVTFIGCVLLAMSLCK
ncbi:MAG: hypothetical protein FWG94_11980 [Oscillospiraceae bacterium]|nr:hypothetical protein [Oscillospiraceae bacterium]